MDSAERLKRLKALLGVSDDTRDALLAGALEDMEQAVLAYLNQPALPPGLERALVLMTAQRWREQPPGSENRAVGPVSAITRGDLSTTFATAAAAADGGEGGGGCIPAGWLDLLHCYRRPRR